MYQTVMVWWIFEDGRPAAVFRACSILVAVGALIGIMMANAVVDPASEWANEIRYAIVLASALVAWVIANDQYRRLAVARRPTP